MVVVGGRVSIPGEEPIPVTCDQMSKSVEILWWKPPPQQQQPTGKVQMLNSVMELYNNTHLSDMTLVVEDRQIPAHRHVLATHSSMFDRMWNHSMKEVRALLASHVKDPVLQADACCGRAAAHICVVHTGHPERCNSASCASPVVLLLVRLRLWYTVKPCYSECILNVITLKQQKQGKAPSQGNYAINLYGLVMDLQVETSEVHISDFDYDTISWMLRYMYGCLELSPQNLSHAKVTFASAAGKCAAAVSSTVKADPAVAAMLGLHLQLLLLLQHDCTCSCCCS